MAGEKLMTENTQLVARIKPFRGEISGYYLERRGAHTVLVGRMGDSFLTTSPVVRIDFDSMMVETRNSLYRIVD